MSKFKVGDLVIPSKPSEHLTKGEAYEVISSSARQFVVNDDAGDYISCFYERCRHGGQWTHYGQTLAELNVKAGDVVEFLSDLVGNRKYTILDNMCLRSDLCVCIDYRISWDSCNKFRIISRASGTPNWLPCPADYKPQGNHEVTYHMGVPTHYYVTEPVLVDVVRRVGFMGGNVWHDPIAANATLRGQTHDGKPVGQWTIDMDAD